MCTGRLVKRSSGSRPSEVPGGPSVDRPSNRREIVVNLTLFVLSSETPHSCTLQEAPGSLTYKCLGQRLTFRRLASRRLALRRKLVSHLYWGCGKSCLTLGPESYLLRKVVFIVQTPRCISTTVTPHTCNDTVRLCCSSFVN